MIVPTRRGDVPVSRARSPYAATRPGGICSTASSKMCIRDRAFDEPPGDVVKEVKKAKALPDLKGREISFVINPVAGEQVKLSQLQAGYLHAVWEGLAKAAGAKRVEFFDGTGTTAGQGVGPVSYTHLDVYKRQAVTISPNP